MNKIILALIFSLFATLAQAQTSRNPCFTTGATTTQGILNCVNVGTFTSTSGWGPLPVGGLATASAPTFIEGKEGGLSFDLSGNLRTTVSGGGGTQASNITQWNSVNLGSPSAYGTSPGAVTVPGVNSFVTNTVTTTGAGGTFPITGATSNASSAVATSSTNVPTVSYNYGFNGATWDQLQVDASKYLKVNCSAGCSASGVADEAAFTAGTSTYGPVGGFFQTTATSNALTNGQGGWWQMTANRAGFVNVRNSSGTELGVTANPFVTAGAGTAGSAAGGVLTVQGVASMTKLLVTPDSVALPANQSVNVSQINAVTPLMGNGVTGTGSQRVTIASDNTAFAVNATLQAGSALVGKVGIDQTTPGTTNAVQANIASGGVASGAIASGAFAAGSFVNATAGDPCMFQPKTNVTISTATGTVALVTGVSSKKIYICSFSYVASAADAISLAEGSGATCGTSNQAGVIGVATNGTQGNGLSLAANGGLTLGNGGGTVAQTATAANYLCLFHAAVQGAGNLTYVQQ